MFLFKNDYTFKQRKKFDLASLNDLNIWKSLHKFFVLGKI